MVRSATSESRLARYSLIALSLLFVALFLVMPLAVVFTEAFANGPGEFWTVLNDPETFSAIQLTLLVAAIAVPLNLVFGIAAAWAIAKFEFKGKGLPDDPDRPALFRLAGHLGSRLRAALRLAQRAWTLAAEYGIKILFAVPGIVLATVFITFPSSPAS